MNIAPLRQAILKETSIFGGILFALMIGLYFIYDMHNHYGLQYNRTESATQRLIAEKQQVENSFTHVQNNMRLYNEALARARTPGMFIDREAVRDLFNIYRLQFYLKKIALDMQPATEISSNPQYSRKTLIGIKSQGQIEFEAVSDEDIYRMIRALHDELPGFVKIEGLEIFKAAEVTKKVIIDIRTQGSAELVSGKIKFTWYGIKSPDPNSEFNKYNIKQPKQRRRR